MQSIVTSAAVQAYARRLLTDTLRLVDYQHSCPVTTLLAIVFTACAKLCSLVAACRHLATAPSRETVRKALASNLPEIQRLERRLNDALADPLDGRLGRQLRRRRHPLAIDLHLRPYHGQHQRDPNELVRGQAKSGTTHFHAYATAYLVVKGQRFTLALTYVKGDEKYADVVKRLLRRCAQLGIRPSVVLLDRGFWSVAVIAYLQAARYPFLMPVIARGKKAEQPAGPSGTRVYQYWTHGGYDSYTLQETGNGKKRCVRIAVHLRYRRGRRGKKGRERLVYAFWGWQPGSLHGLSELYRRRFGIETSYRQLGEAKPTTCSRSPEVRLFLVGVALVLRNVWVWLHHEVLSTPRRGRRRYNAERLYFRDLLTYLQQEAERAFGVRAQTFTERPLPKELTT
jgi:putative transposase